MNVFKKHKQRVEAQAAVAAAGTSDAAPSSVMEQMAAQMRAHKTELTAIQSRNAKNERKAELLPDYEAYVDGVLAAEIGVQDDTVMTVMIWAIDAGSYDYAINIAEWAIVNDLETPPEFTRDVQTLLTDGITDAALTDRAEIAKFKDALHDALAVVGGSDMPDQVSAKLMKALSWSIAEDDPRKALEHAKSALAFDSKAGVKQDIKALEKTVAALEAGSGSNET